MRANALLRISRRGLDAPWLKSPTTSTRPAAPRFLSLTGLLKLYYCGIHSRVWGGDHIPSEEAGVNV